MPGGGEPGHVDADLGDDAFGGPFADPGDCVEAVTGRRERDHLAVCRSAVEGVDRGLEVVDVVQTMSRSSLAW